jgi:hypothetical protein
LKVKKRNPKRSGAATSYATSTKSQQTDPNIPEQSPERQLMEDKFLTYDYTKPYENENRRKMIEQRYWAQKMNKTTGEKTGGLHPNHAYGSTRRAGGTYKASVLDHLNQKPTTPLTAGDILKLEELARTARTNAGKEKGNDWRPPSGLMGNSLPDGSPLDAVQARDDYILQNGGVPPPSRPPPLTQPYNRVINNSSKSLNTNTTTASGYKPSQEYSPSSYQTRRDSDDSYRLASSPDNSEYPLIASAAALSVEYSMQPPPHQHHSQQQHQFTNNTINNNNNSTSKMYSVSTTSTTSSHTLHDPSSKSTNTTTSTSATATTFRPPPVRMSSIPRMHGTPLPPPTSLPPPIPSELPPLPPLPKNYI